MCANLDAVPLDNNSSDMHQLQADQYNSKMNMLSFDLKKSVHSSLQEMSTDIRFPGLGTEIRHVK